MAEASVVGRGGGGKVARVDPEVAWGVCRAVSGGALVKDELKKAGIRPEVWYDFVEHSPEWVEIYQRARVNQAHTMAEEVIEISDDRSLSYEDRRAMVDGRKWFTSKIAPRIYGDKGAGVQVTVNNVEAQVWRIGDKDVTF